MPFWTLKTNFCFQLIFRLVDFLFYFQLRDVDTDVSKYLDNPLNAFLVTKRLTADLESIEATLKTEIDDGMCIVNYQFKGF